MTAKDSAPQGAFPFHLALTSLMALMTLAGGILLVSQKLTSDRPATPPGASLTTMGQQQVEARLWEDPFKWHRDSRWISQMDKPNPIRPIDRLTERITLEASLSNQEVSLLVVMVPGGPYSEDREQRIRSRYAIVSALGESGYRPEDAEHIGALPIAWPSSAELKQQIKAWSDGKPQTNSPNATSTEGLSTQSVPGTLESRLWTGTLRASFEWYRRRVFHPPPKANQPANKVLVVWLPENSFDDDFPLWRLAHVFASLAGTDSPQPNTLANYFRKVSLIGPRWSSTLRAMLPDYEKNLYRQYRENQATHPSVSITNLAPLPILKQVNLHLATPSAMDEVFVKRASEAADFPRQAVMDLLSPRWFKSCQNHGATDNQLAREILDELKLREVDLGTPKTGPPKNLVLISEWDTFYGRMLSMTYAAEVAKDQGSASRYEFVSQYRSGSNVWPTNVYSFAYLRGLDGQVIGQTSGREATASSKPEQPATLEQLMTWTPDVNKAVGEAQFDYLARLGDNIADLEQDLHRRQAGCVNAIGIVGGDVYDTLLILQALHGRFPNAIFFTTDLDTRLWQLSEEQWSRNLIVASGYGLQLHPKLQGRVAPFRDSGQTAQYAAALSALEHPGLHSRHEVLARRFEIGHLRAVDLSVANGAVGSEVHPIPLAARGGPFLLPRRIIGLALVLLGGGLLLTLYWRPFTRLTWGARQFESECLWLREEDIGGAVGSVALTRKLRASSDPLAKWIWARFPASVTALAGPPNEGENESPEAPDSAASYALVSKTPESMQDLLDCLNHGLLQDTLTSTNAIQESALVTRATKEACRRRKAPCRLKWKRQVFEDLMENLVGVPPKKGTTLLEREGTWSSAAASARKASLANYQYRRQRRWGVWITVPLAVASLVILIRIAFKETYDNPVGEAFSFTSGISIWPCEILRWLAAGLALWFVAESFSGLRTSLLEITRRYRFPFTLPGASPISNLSFSPWNFPADRDPQAKVDTAKLWMQYQKLSRFWLRMGRILLPAVLYVLFGFGIMFQSDFPTRPARGETAQMLDQVMLIVSVAAFLFLTFWTMDGSRLCRWFVEHLSEAPTHYPKVCVEHFQRLHGVDDERLVGRWIDLKLIAELTERISHMVYYPFIVFFILFIARHSQWDHWTWPWSLFLIFVLNLCLAVICAVILQRAARKARDLGREDLRQRIAESEKVAAKDPEGHKVNVARRLLDEIDGLRTGAFVPLKENPILGAILLPSGGIAFLELLSYLLKS